MKKLSNKKIKEIKNFLINCYKVTTWEECIDHMKFGHCKTICKLIAKQFPNTFTKMISITFDYSPEAISLLNDNEDMFGNHYILCIGNNMYDFARGCNCINGIYVMTQNNNLDKYDITLTEAENDLIISYVNYYF